MSKSIDENNNDFSGKQSENADSAGHLKVRYWLGQETKHRLSRNFTGTQRIRRR